MIVRPLILATVAAHLALLTHVAISQVDGIPVFDGLTFGALLAGYLAVCHRVRSPGRLLALIGISGISFIAAIYATEALTIIAFLFVRIVRLSDSPEVFAPLTFLGGGVLGAAVISPTFLFLVPRPPTMTPPLKQVAICAAAGGGLALLGSLLIGNPQGAHPNFLPLMVVWQSAIAFVLALFADPPLHEHAAPDESQAQVYGSLHLNG